MFLIYCEELKLQNQNQKNPSPGMTKSAQTFNI